MPTKTILNLSQKTERRLTVGCVYLGEKKVPTLRLSGNWLLEAGFGFNQKVRVQIDFGRILIRPVEEESLCL